MPLDLSALESWQWDTVCVIRGPVDAAAPRSSANWHRLLELGSLADGVIVDERAVRQLPPGSSFERSDRLARC